MKLRLDALLDRLRSSLFWVPVLFVGLGIVAGQAGIALDRTFDVSGQAPLLPLGLGSTVDSARAVLSTIAGATISFAGIAFSVSLLVIQLASSQYSPRVVHGLFRDPFNKRIMGIVIGTFTYCLVVLRSVRGPLEESGSPVIPNISVAVAVVLGLIAILAIVGFINHSAHSMDISKILHKVTGEAMDAVLAARQASGDEDEQPREEDLSVPDDEGFVVTMDSHGWVQQIDQEALLALVTDDGVIQVETLAGRYAIKGADLCTIWPVPEDKEQAATKARTAVAVGQTRTMQQDLAYGVRQLADVALKAMSPGVNDPTTAQDAMFHLGSLLQTLLTRKLPDRVLQREGGGRVVLAEGPVHADLIAMAFDEVRIASATQPTVCIYLLEILYLLDVAVRREGNTAASAAICEQAALVLAVNAKADLLDHDHRQVRSAYDNRFGAKREASNEIVV